MGKMSFSVTPPCLDFMRFTMGDTLCSLLFFYIQHSELNGTFSMVKS